MSSKVVDRIQCPKCHAAGGDRSQDNLVVFADGGSKCYKCGYYKHSDNGSTQPMTQSPKKRVKNSTVQGEIQALPHRAISEQTCRDYNYSILSKNGIDFELASYYNSDGKMVAQKARNPETKEFYWLGDPSEVSLYGSNKVTAGGPMLVVTEGEIDAMSVYEAFGRKYPAVSLPNGASSAKKVFQENIDLLNSFDKVIIYFDNDDPGHEAAKAAAEVLNPGKAYFACISDCKDANDALVASRSSDIINAVYRAREYRPDGIVHIRDVPLTASLTEGIQIFDFPFECMTQATYGLMSGEVAVLASGSGMGKSTVIREMIYKMLTDGYSVGALMLEESVTKTKQDIASIHIEKPIHLATTAKEINSLRAASGLKPIEFGHTEEVTEAELAQANAFLNDKPLYVYDHWGSVEVDVLLRRLNYMAHSCNCDVIFIDHLSIIVTGTDGDERRDLDRLMAELKGFAQRTKVAVVAICHLKKSNSTPHEEGGQVSLSDFRGSGALYQYADKCFGFERNQQSDDHDAANIMKIRVLKNRFSGRTGVVGGAKFYPERHRLIEVEIPDDSPF